MGLVAGPLPAGAVTARLRPDSIIWCRTFRGTAPGEGVTRMESGAMAVIFMGEAAFQARIRHVEVGSGAGAA